MPFAPAKPSFGNLDRQEIEQIVKVALDAQFMLGGGDYLSASEIVPNRNFDAEMNVALWSCFSSEQRRKLKEMQRDASGS